MVTRNLWHGAEGDGHNSGIAFPGVTATARAWHKVLMPEDVDPEDLFVTDDAYAAGRRAFTEGLSVLQNPMAQTGDWGKAWFSGWLDALADAVTGHDRQASAFRLLLRRDRAEPF
jgi:hypothetical protein